MSIYTILGLFLAIIISWFFFKEIGKTIPVLQIMLFIAALQWVVGPVISYTLEVKHFKYYMYVDELTYMSYVVPGLLAFFIAISIFIKKVKIPVATNYFQYASYGRIILIIGIISDLLLFIIPSSLAFVFYLMAQFIYVGAGILLFSRRRIERIYFFIALVYLIARSISSAMFHELILWSIFLFFIWAIKSKPTKLTKSLIIASGLIAIVSIQIVKARYRDMVWDRNVNNKTKIFINLIGENVHKSYFEEEKNISDLNVRLNQGWIISKIMSYVPSKAPFAHGETIKDAVIASLVPRFLNPNKKTAGGIENMRKFTGIRLKNTAMGVSIIGEAYGNFGVIGGILFMGIWGLFLIWFLKVLSKQVYKHPILIFFVPLIFLQVVKAESDMITVFNHLVKSSLLLALFFWTVRKLLGWNV